MTSFAERTRKLMVIELERAWRTRTTWIVAAAMLGVAALVTLGAAGAAPSTAAAAPAAASAGAPVEELRTALSGLAALRVFVVLLGILCVTTEFHHGDIVWRCLAEPSRGVLVAAKAAACGLIGALLGLLAVQIGILIEVGFGSPGATYGLTWAEALQAVAGSVIGAALAGVLGVGIGAAVRNQTAAVVGTLVAVLLVEPVLSGLAPGLGAFLPSAAAAAAAGHAAAMGAAAGLVLTAGYAALAFGVGSLLCARRDV